jgi:FkbM family methyltransferase
MLPAVSGGFTPIIKHARDRLQAGTHLRAAFLGRNATAFYRRLIHAGDLVFDVGANNGDHTAAMLRCGANVVALEPQAHLARELQRRFPSATVLRAGASDKPGEAKLFTSSDHDELATFSPVWKDMHSDGYAQWDGEEAVPLTTLDALISDYGLPALVKIDTEGFDDRVLDGLSQPIDQIIFEAQPGLPDVAARAFARIDSLGTYEYRVMWQQNWKLQPPGTSSEIMAALPGFSDVHARLLAPNRQSSSPLTR